MFRHGEHIEWIAVRDIVPGSNARSVAPSRDRVLEHARSIAHFGILVPLIAERRDGICHLLAGNTRLAALREVRDDSVLVALAQLNKVDLERVPVRFFTGDEQSKLLLPVVENNFRDLMNDVDLARRVRLMLDTGTPPAMLESFFGSAYYKRLLAVLELPLEVQQMIRDGRMKSSTALKFARDIPKPRALVRALQRASHKVDELYRNGRRRILRVTEAVVRGKHTPMRVVNEVAAKLDNIPPTRLGLTTAQTDVVCSVLHGLQHGMNADAILNALESGTHITAPPVKKRGRKPKAR